MRSAALHVELLAQARRLATQERGRPRQASLRRAVSSAYYGLFHFLVDEASKSMLRSRSRSRPARLMIGRAFQHSTMAQASRAFAASPVPERLRSALGSAGVPAVVSDLSGAFFKLQEERHRADYDLTARFERAEVLSELDRVESLVHRWPSSRSHSATRLYLASLLAWDRLRDR